MIELILATSSKNRHALFDRLGVAYTVAKPDFAEVVDPSLSAADQVMAFAEGKLASVFSAYENRENVVVISFDSMIHFRGAAIGKAENEQHMMAMMRDFRGQTQEVITGVCVRGRVDGVPFSETFHAISVARFRGDYTDGDIAAYAKYGDWAGKCGAWSVLGTGLFFLESLSGSFQNVVGVPVIELRKRLEALTNKSIFELFQPRKS